MAENLTPMLAQYQAIKKAHTDCILLFRLGDFYEMFYDDALKAAPILDVVLTSRGKSPTGKIPMCGVPYHAADTYIAKLIKAGLKAAICEQTEDPALAKGIVKREVIRVITSGTYIDENSSEPRYLLSIHPDKQGIAVAFTDAVRGTILSNYYDTPAAAIETLSKISLYECVYPQTKEGAVKEIFQHPLLRNKNILFSPAEDWMFNMDIARKSLCEHFHTQSLRGFGIDDLPAAIAACGALLEYMRTMNKQPLRHVDKISLYTDNDFVFITPAACYGLELEKVLKAIDTTLTPLGKRMLQSWLYHPLKDIEAIQERQDALRVLTQTPALQEALSKLLRNTPDIEKSLSRMSCGYSNVKDLLALRSVLARVPELQEATKAFSEKNKLFSITDIPGVRALLLEAVNPDIPLSNPDGKIINPGYHKEHDELRDIQENGRQWLKSLQAEEIQRTGINSLKIGFNNVFGYYIEISKANLKSVPANYIRKQTLVNGERFITEPLKEFEEKMLTAVEKIKAIEASLIKQIETEILNHVVQLHTLCTQLATLDTLLCLNTLAKRPGYSLPIMTNTTEIIIHDGKHPVVEQMLDTKFIPNDTLLDCEDNHLLILTGPNMAGKSTYIRQTALLVILAQMGSYIPAASASIGIVDKIFTRIGAHDEISRGQSTFMVEMSECAEILNNLSSRSLVILDEIGRGTSTYDGFSLAWAVAEYLQKHKVRCLFATHFHELTALSKEFTGVKNYNVAVKKWKDEIIFLHKITPGGTDDSYGIYVARLAGIPQEVIDRAKHILMKLEIHGNLHEKVAEKTPPEQQVQLFNDVADPSLKKIKDSLEKLDVNSLTPLEALNKLHELKEILNSDQ